MNFFFRYHSRTILLSCFFAGACLFLRCIQTLAGGTSTTDNPRVVGTVIGDDDRPAPNTQVLLLPVNFDPVRDDSGKTVADTTDEAGRFELTVSRPGIFNIQAVHLVKRTRLLIRGIVVESGEDSVAVAGDTLKPSGAVMVELPDSVDRANGYMYVPGTTVFTFLSDAGAQVMLNSVPATVLPAVCYATKNAAVPAVLRYNVRVLPEATAIVAMPGWKYSARLSLNTASSGAGVAGNVLNFPVLVRLNDENFIFNQAQRNGGDIRFTKDNGSPLAFEIERWDSANGVSEIWVRVDTVRGSNDTQSITMYWGNANASDSTNGARVFDTENGFIGVWHLSEAPANGSASLKDQTANRYHAIPFGSMSESNSVNGAIGNAVRLNGRDDYLVAGNVPVKGTYTIGLWVQVETTARSQRFIHKDSAYTLWYDTVARSLRMEHMSDTSWWRGMLQDGGTPVATSVGMWQYLVGTYDGTEIRLYKNGREESRTNPFSVPPITNANQLYLGKSQKNIDYVKGSMDEIRIETPARSADWIRLCYMNQRKDDKLVVVK